MNIIGLDELLVSQSSKSDFILLSGIFFGYSFSVLSYSIIQKIIRSTLTQTNDYCYIEKKINTIFNTNFLPNTKSPNERIRTIENFFAEYEIDVNIDMATEISSINQKLLNQLNPIILSILTVGFIIIPFSSMNPQFIHGILIGLVILSNIILIKSLSESKKWKLMYYDLMQIKSNRKNQRSN